MKSFLLKADDVFFEQIENVSAMKNVTKTAFIRESISRNLRYFSKVERERYENIQKMRTDFNEPLTFFSSEFSNN